MGAVSVDRRTGALRWLCMAQGTYVEAAPWSVATAKPATLYLAPADDALVLQTWGEHRGPVRIKGPGLSAGFAVSELDADGRPTTAVKANASPQGLRFEIEGGRAYRLARPRE